MKLVRLIAKIVALGVLALHPISNAAELEKIEDVRLIESEANDGDSFLVKADGEQLHLRLYYVDCPELKASKKSMLRRLRTQTRYFGLENARRTVFYAKEAKRFTERQLKEPFTVYTAYAKVPGGSESQRHYAFVVSSDGEYLDRLLVKNGLARAYGLGRGTPDGIPRDEMKEQMDDLEAVAMLTRSGIWGESDPERILELRKKMREEERGLKEIEEELIEDRKLKFPIDINTASAKELMEIKGIAEARSKIIIKNRPYQTLDELYEIKGLPSNIVSNAIRHLRIGQDPDLEADD